jgi:hypothetical protein
MTDLKILRWEKDIYKNYVLYLSNETIQYILLHPIPVGKFGKFLLNQANIGYKFFFTGELKEIDLSTLPLENRKEIEDNICQKKSNL